MQSLSQSDVDSLLRDPSAETRAAIAQRVAGLFCTDSLTDTQRHLVEDIFRVLVREAEQRVRQALSENLCRSNALPHDIALALASDLDAVALPMLESSTVLTDDDLIGLLEGANGAKRCAMARRPAVSERLAGALIETDDADAVAVLAANGGAVIGEPGLNRILDTFPQAPAIHAPLVHRPWLPVGIVERLVVMVSDNLRVHLVTHHEVHEDVAADIIRETRERATIGLSREPGALMDLLRQLHGNGRLTPSIILRALCLGDLAFFEAALAIRARLPVANARILIHDKGGLGLRAVYDRAGMPESLYLAVKIAVEIGCETDYDGGEGDRERRERRMIERVLTRFEDFGRENVEYLLGRLKRLH